MTANRTRRHKIGTRGFSFLESIVVIFIIILLVSVVIPGLRHKGRIEKESVELKAREPVVPEEPESGAGTVTDPARGSLPDGP